MSSGKITNKHIHSNDQAKLKQLADDYRYSGFDVQLTGDELVIFARPRPKMRDCQVCGNRKPVREFPRRSKDFDPPKTCKKCVRGLKEERKNG